MRKKKPVWRLKGYDTFSGETYDLKGQYSSKKEVEEAARKRVAELEKSQPSETSGGQGLGSIQDQVFIERPDGTRYRFSG